MSMTLYTKDFVIGVFLGILFIAVATTIFMQQLYISKLAVIEETIEKNYKNQSEGKHLRTFKYFWLFVSKVFVQKMLYIAHFHYIFFAFL